MTKIDRSALEAFAANVEKRTEEWNKRPEVRAKLERSDYSDYLVEDLDKVPEGFKAGPMVVYGYGNTDRSRMNSYVRAIDDVLYEYRNLIKSDLDALKEIDLILSAYFEEFPR